VLFFSGNKNVYRYVAKSNVYISVITEMELKSNSALKKSERALLDSFLKTTIIVDMNDTIKEDAIKMIRINKLKLADTIIASTANYMKMDFVSGDGIFART
jgi:predicted nucleic acid-binding protein